MREASKKRHDEEETKLEEGEVEAVVDKLDHEHDILSAQIGGRYAGCSGRH